MVSQLGDDAGTCPAVAVRAARSQCFCPDRRGLARLGPQGHSRPAPPGPLGGSSHPRAPSSCSLVTAGGSVPGHSVCGHRFRAQAETPTRTKDIAALVGDAARPQASGAGPQGTAHLPLLQPTHLPACVSVSPPGHLPQGHGKVLSSQEFRSNRHLTGWRANDTCHSTAGTRHNHLTLKGHRQPASSTCDTGGTQHTPSGTLGV